MSETKFGWAGYEMKSFLKERTFIVWGRTIMAAMTCRIKHSGVVVVTKNLS